MGRIRSFLGVFAFLVTVLFAGNSFAAGYTCTTKQYVSCNSGYYLKGSGAGNSCEKCPTDYPNSPSNNTGGITSCYSNTKSRSLSCTQDECSNPDTTGCSSYTCASSCSCSGSACNYVAYSNDSGTGDGVIKDGCATNTASCTKAVKSLTAKENFYVNGTTSCPACTSPYLESGGGDISSDYCYRMVTKTGDQNDGDIPDGCASVTEWNPCSAGTCEYVDYKGSSVTDGTCTAKSCEKTAKTVTANTNHYVNGATCPACPDNSSSSGGSAASCTCDTNYSANGSSTTTTEACTLNSFSITYDLDGGTNYSGAPTSYTVGTGATINGTPTKTNHSFAGWCTDEAKTSCATSQTISTTATGDKKFYAKWTENTISVSAPDKSQTYDGSALTCSISVSSPTGATVKYGKANGTYNLTSAPTVTNVADSTTIYYQVTKDNYTTKTGSFKCTVNKAANPITISAASGSTEYPSTKTFTVSNAQGAVTVASADTNVATVAYSNGTVTMTPQKGDGSTVKITVTAAGGDNYNSGSKSYNLTVNPGTISVSATDKSKTYDGSALTCSISVTSPTGATVKYGTDGKTYSTTVPTVTNVKDSTTIYYQVTKTNYTTKTGSFKCTVNKAANTLTLNATSGTIVYPNTGTFTITNAQGSVTVESGDTSVATVSHSNGTVTITSVKPGTATITVKADGNDNYNAGTKTYNLTVSKGTNTLTLNAASGTIVYPNTGTFTITNAQGSVTVVSETEAVATVTHNNGTVTMTPVKAGTSKITVTAAGNDYYNSGSKSYNLTVNRGTCDITLSPASGTLTYPTTTSTFTIDKGSCNGTISVASGNTDVATVALNTAKTQGTVTYVSAPGTATITVSSAQTDQYNSASATYKATTRKGTNTLTLSASSGSMAYSSNATFTVDTNTSGGALSVKTSSSGVATATISGTTVTVSSKAAYGSAVITVTSAETANYNTASAEYAVTVNKGTITLNNRSATSAGTSAIYQTYNTNVYLDSAHQNVMTTSAYAITVPTRTGYTFGGYYSANDGTGTQYIGANGYITTDGVTAGKGLKANGTWYAKWTPNNYTITLNNANATTNGSSAIYTTYATNVYVDSARKNAMTTSANGITIPQRKYTVTYNANSGTVTPASALATYTFNGYYSASTGGTQYIDGNGKITSAGLTAGKGYAENKTWNTQWTSVAVTLPTPTRTGYTFGGWYSDSTLKTSAGAAGANYTPTNDVTLYAKWTANTLTINYDTSGATSGASSVTNNTQTCTYDQACTAAGMGTLAKTKMVFLGWAETQGGTTVDIAVGASIKNIISSGSKTLYAVWKTPTCSATHATATLKSVSNNKPVCTISCSTGYTKEGGTDATSSFDVTGNAGATSVSVPCYAITYTIAYVANKPGAASGTIDGTMASTGAEYDKSVVLASNKFALKGWTFTKWNSLANGTGAEYANGATVKNLTATAGATVNQYAQWSANKYTIVYNSNKPSTASGTISGATASSSHTYDVVKKLTDNGYKLTGWTFAGWNTEADGSGTSYANGESVVNLVSEDSGSKTLYAQWTANTLTIYFNNGGATGSPAKTSITCKYDAACSATTQGTMLNTNHTYEGWTDVNGGTTVKYNAGASIKNIITGGSTTLYAVWDACPTATKGTNVASSVLNGVTDNVCRYTHTCSVGYYNANHLKKITSASINCAACTDLPDDAKWTGAATTDTCTWECDACVMGANATACAVSKNENARTCTYTGTCNANTFNPVATASTISCTVCPVNSFTDMDNINTFCNCAVGHTTNGKVTGPQTTTTTMCTPITDYKINYVMNGGTNYTDAPGVYKYGVGATIDGTPVRVGYTFAGWCSDSTLNSCTSKYIISDFAAGTQDVYAKWTANSYKILFNKNGATGDIQEDVVCTFDSGKCAMPAVISLVKPGYVATGKLCENADGSGKCYDANGNVAVNISNNATDTTLYVIWEPGVFKITLMTPDASRNDIQAPVYLKYTVGWYSDANAENVLINMDETRLPERDGYVFDGYRMADGIKIVSSAGVMQTTQAELTSVTADSAATVMWQPGKTVCPAGYYYPGQGGICNVCGENHWCPGGTFDTDTKIVGGHNECADGGVSSGGISATHPGVCYKNLLPYTSATGLATGTQTCHYNTESTKYDLTCYNFAVSTCAGGYYFVSGNDCTEVGQDYYSAEGSMLKNPCPEDGVTGSLTTANSATQCYKTVAYNPTYGAGTQVCNWTDYDVGFTTNCRSKFIARCIGGYYRATPDATDCVPVGYGAYSLINSIDRILCPEDGKTDSQTADDATLCYQPNYPFVTAHGSGGRYCNFSISTQGYTNCQTNMFTSCHDGYYWAKVGDEDCVPVGYGYFGPVAADDNMGYMTGRDACPAFLTRQGMTQTATSASASACYMTRISCNVPNGSGIKQCGYNTSTADYTADCSECMVTLCESKYYLNDNKCNFCPENEICDELSRKDSDENGVPDGEPLMCKAMFNNQYPYADAGSIFAGQCWGVCDLLENVVKMIGRDYQGYPMDDTCEIQICEERHYLTDDKSACLICPENYICGPETTSDLDDDDIPDASPKTCDEISGGIHIYSPEGSVDPTQCYAKCEEFDIIGGRAYPKKEIVYFGSDVCDYIGMSDTGNPCQIKDTPDGLACIEVSCNPDFELIDGKCQECKRPHATAYKANGNCLIAKCDDDYHPERDQCVANVQSCVMPNAVRAEKTWTDNLGSYGICEIKECEDGYHIASNACVPNTQSCEIKNGTGIRQWDTSRKAWGDCVVTSCKPGYTNNPRESNEPLDPTKKCGACRNTFGLNGQVAVSTWISGCEIGACLYQGELYNLEDNKCVAICNRAPDETGSMRWDDDAKKCIRECKPGYKSW